MVSFTTALQTQERELPDVPLLSACNGECRVGAGGRWGEQVGIHQCPLTVWLRGMAPTRRSG